MWGYFWINTSVLFYFTNCMGLKNKSNHFSSHVSKAALNVDVHQIILRSIWEADDSSQSYILFFSTSRPVHNNFSICYYFCNRFSLSGERSLISCLPLMKWVLHKPIQTKAMAAATKIIYSESAQRSDTSISSPAGDRENRGGHYKDHIAGKVGAIFYPTLTLSNPQTRPFSPGALPSYAPLKLEACFLLNKLLHPLICLWWVLYRVSFATCSSLQVCASCVWKWGSEYTSVCTPSCLITGWCVMAFQSYCYHRQSFIIVLQQTSISKWHQLTNYKSLRLIRHCAGSGWGLLLVSAIPKPPEHFSK